MRLNGMEAEATISELEKDMEFIQRESTCMIGGFYIINSQPMKKCYYLAAFENKEIRYMYPSYEAAFADLIILHKAKDLEVIIT